jgi:hypothetical protein
MCMGMYVGVYVQYMCGVYVHRGVGVNVCVWGYGGVCRDVYMCVRMYICGGFGSFG